MERSNYLDYDNDDDDSSSTSSSSSSPFELQAKADEWMDVTPKEELLRAQVDRLKEAFDKCSTQLDRSRLENELLKDREVALELETNDLRTSLDATHFELQNTQLELTTTKTSSKEAVANLERKLTASTEEATRSKTMCTSLEVELTKTVQEHAVAITTTTTQHNNNTTTIQGLERALKSQKAETKTHRDTAVRFAEDLRTTRETIQSTRRELDDTRNRLETERQLLAQAKTTTGTIATLAENLKVEKQGLERALLLAEAAHRSSGMDAESQARKLSLQVEKTHGRQLTELKELHITRTAALQSELTERLRDLEGSNKSVEVLQTELKDSERQQKELSIERNAFLDRKSELEESLETVQDDLLTAHDQLHLLQESFSKAVLERDTLRSHRDTYLQSSEKEADLERRLFEQRRTFEDRLKDIHGILGLKFTTAVHSEVREFHKSAIEQTLVMIKQPTSFFHHVPLIDIATTATSTATATATSTE